MRLVPGEFLSELGGQVTVSLEAVAHSMSGSMVIFDGDRIMVYRGLRGSDIDVLPPGVVSSIKKVRKEHIYAQLVEMLRIEFYNGSFATLILHEQRPDPIDDEDLQEFRARCVMIHDL
ncbi:hypothetical protein LCGC14_0893370 [marine sediment metagenome]|uniref:Uncharacterized protein n=1 Tax=marine sediment metagenome TaxID=412755 RepID=A0A0F9S5F8_9ZZZZ